MIHLIGGHPESGTKRAAVLFSKAKRVPWFPVDYLMVMVRKYASKATLFEQFPLDYFKEQMGCEELFQTYSADQIIDFYRTQSESAQVGIQYFIEKMVAANQDFILEGYQLEPGFVGALRQQFPENTIRSILLHKEHTLNMVIDLKDSIDDPYFSVSDDNNDASPIKIATVFKEYGDILKQEATVNSIPAFDMSGISKSLLERAVSYLE